MTDRKDKIREALVILLSLVLAVITAVLADRLMSDIDWVTLGLIGVLSAYYWLDKIVKFLK